MTPVWENDEQRNNEAWRSSSTIHTDNKQTLVNAVARITELEAINLNYATHEQRIMGQLDRAREAKRKAKAEVERLKAEKFAMGEALVEMGKEVLKREADRDRLRGALKPFAIFATEMPYMGGNFPRSGGLYEIHGKPGGEGVTITVEDFKEALAAAEGGQR